MDTTQLLDPLELTKQNTYVQRLVERARENTIGLRLNQAIGIFIGVDHHCPVGVYHFVTPTKEYQITVDSTDHMTLRRLA